MSIGFLNDNIRHFPSDITVPSIPGVRARLPGQPPARARPVPRAAARGHVERRQRRKVRAAVRRGRGRCGGAVGRPAGRDQRRSVPRRGERRRRGRACCCCCCCCISPRRRGPAQAAADSCAAEAPDRNLIANGRLFRWLCSALLHKRRVVVVVVVEGQRSSSSSSIISLLVQEESGAVGVPLVFLGVHHHPLLDRLRRHCSPLACPVLGVEGSEKRFHCLLTVAQLRV